jgi:hypothetical protein
MTDIDAVTGQDAWLHRKDEISSAFRGGATNPVVDRVAGASLASGGFMLVGYALLGPARGPRRLWLSLFGGLLMLGGLAVLGGGALGRRHEHISEAEAEIRNQLAALDPIARAEVLKDMASEQVAPITSRLKHRAD